MPDNRSAVYLEGDTVIYRASALGHCLRSLWAARSGLEAKPFPQSIQAAMDEGTELEPKILNILYEKYHWGFSYDSQFQVELNVGAWNGKTLTVRGHLDERRDDGLPVDVKAFAQSTIDDIPDYYWWQQSVYTHALGVDRFYMPIYNKDTQEIMPRSLVPLFPKYTRDQIRDRVLSVEEAYYNNTMPDFCSSDFGCPYYYLHERKELSTLPENAVPIILARIKLTEKIRTLDTARKRLDEVIIGKLDQDVTYFLDNYNIVMFANPARFNTNAAKALLTEAEVDWENDPEFWIPGKGTQLRMTPKKANDERTH